MKKLGLVLMLVFILVLTSCSSDPMAEGDKFYQEGQYAKAVNMYNEVLKTQPDNSIAREKAALATVKVGQELYNRRKVLSPFVKYYENAVTLIPDNTSQEFNKEFSVLLFELAQAYLNSEPRNNQEKKERFDNVLMYYDEALFYDPDNSAAMTALEEFQNKHFAEMMEKGTQYYQKARKQKNDLYYLNAEYYFKKANKFNSEDADAAKMLETVRKINLNKINPDLDYPLAIISTLVKDEYTAVQVYLENRTAGTCNVQANMFMVLDKDGNEYKGEITDVFNATFKEGTVASGKGIEGVISFKTGGKQADKFDKLIFDSPEGIQSVKYFP